MKADQSRITPANPVAVACEGKQRLTREVAEQIRTRPARGRSCRRRYPYRCAGCGWWHLGSTIASKDQRKRHFRPTADATGGED